MLPLSPQTHPGAALGVLNENQSHGPGWLQSLQTINSFSFANHVVSVAAVTITQFCSCSQSSVRQHVNEWVWLYSNKTLFTETGSG